MKQLNAIDHINKHGMKSRTNKFNATMGAIGLFATPMLAYVPEAYEIAKVGIPSGLVFITTIGNTWLYGDTHVKHSASRKPLN